MGRAVPRDVVPQAYGGQGDEDEVESVQQGPVRLQQVEDDGGEEDGEEEEDRSHQGQVDQADLREDKKTMSRGHYNKDMISVFVDDLKNFPYRIELNTPPHTLL